MKQIPNTFASTKEYFKSFSAPLVEETHADLLSSVKTVSQSLCCEVKSVKPTKGYKPPKDLFYKLVLKVNESAAYEPINGDLIAITMVRPRCIRDLERSYVIASVQGVKDDLTLTVLSSKPILVEDGADKNKPKTLFAVYLMNMLTNIRIWQALTSDPKERNMKIIEKVLQTKFVVRCYPLLA